MLPKFVTQVFVSEFQYENASGPNTISTCRQRDLLRANREDFTRSLLFLFAGQGLCLFDFNLQYPTDCIFIAVIARFVQPSDGLLVILRNALSFFVEYGEVELGHCIALIGGLAIPLSRDGVVLLNSVPFA